MMGEALAVHRVPGELPAGQSALQVSGTATAFANNGCVQASLPG